MKLNNIFQICLAVTSRGNAACIYDSFLFDIEMKQLRKTETELTFSNSLVF